MDSTKRYEPDPYFNRRVRSWLWRLDALLKVMRAMNTEISGYSENLVPETEVWSKLDDINKAIKAAQAEVAKNVERYEKRAAAEFIVHDAKPKPAFDKQAWDAAVAEIDNVIEGGI